MTVSRQRQAAHVPPQILDGLCLPRGEILPVRAPASRGFLRDFGRRHARALGQIRGIEDPILIADEEIAHGIVMLARLRLHVGHPRRQVDDRPRMRVEEPGQLVHAPFEARQVCADETQRRGRARQKAVARSNLLLVRRHLRMQVHVVLGMLAEIAPVVLGSHLIERQPAVAGLAQMTDHRHAQRFDLPPHGSKPGSSSITSLPLRSRKLMPMFFQTLTARAPWPTASLR